MFLAQFDHLLLSDGVCLTGMLGRSTGQLHQGGIPASDEARFPGIEGTMAHMGGVTSQIDIAGGFPGLEQQPPLLGGRQGKMDTMDSIVHTLPS
jgi:hypothetical protein